MNLLFLVPPNIENFNVLRDSVYGCWCKGNRMGGATAPPHPLVLMATCLKDAGHNVHVVDGLVDPAGKQKIQGLVKDLDAVVIQTSVMAFFDDCEVLRWLKELNSQILTIVCGAMPTFLPERSLDSDVVDYILLGEPELACVELVGRLDAKRELGTLAGVGYRLGKKKIVNGRAPLIKDLDVLPHADWRLLDHGQTYFNPIIKRHPYVTELTTRGCFAKCVFCMAPGFYGGKIRGHSDSYVIDALERYARQGIREIYFRDEMFTSLRKRNRRIYEEVIRQKINLTWICSSRVNAVDETDLRLMKRAGCHWIKFGVESGNQDILDGMKKGIHLEEVAETFTLCRKIGINTHAHFMVGNVGETKNTVSDTIRFAKQIKPTTATFGMLNVYPGTPLWDSLEEKHPNLVDQFDLRLKNLHSKSFFTDELTQLSASELEAMITQAHRTFFLRPGYMLSHMKRLRSFDDIKTLFRAGSKVIDFAIKGND